MLEWKYTVELRPSDGQWVWARLLYCPVPFCACYHRATENFTCFDGFSIPWYMVRRWKDGEDFAYLSTGVTYPLTAGPYIEDGVCGGMPAYRLLDSSSWLFWFSLGSIWLMDPVLGVIGGLSHLGDSSILGNYYHSIGSSGTAVLTAV